MWGDVVFSYQSGKSKRQKNILHHGPKPIYLSFATIPTHLVSHWSPTFKKMAGYAEPLLPTGILWWYTVHLVNYTPLYLHTRIWNDL